jgi:hypothetical protein
MTTSYLNSGVEHTSKMLCRLYKIYISEWAISNIILIDCGGVRLTSQNCSHHWPIVHPLGECECRAMVMMMPAGDNSWLVYQSSWAVLPAETSGASIFDTSTDLFTCHKILRHGTSDFTSHPKESVLWLT